MNVRFKKDVTLTVVDSYNEETEEGEYSELKVKQGDVYDVDVFYESNDSVDIQFGDGSVSYNLQKEDVTILSESQQR